LDRKHRRKNYYRNSAAKKRERITRRLYACLKLLTGTALLFFISLVLVFGYDFLTQCDYFKAQSVVVSGIKHLSEKEILEQTDIRKGMNILSINLSTARKRLLALSWISDAEVSRELPSKISIVVREHEPLAILDLGRKFLLNVNGEIFKEKTPSDPGNLPVITGLEYSDLHISGDRPSHRAGDDDLPGRKDLQLAAAWQNRDNPFDAVMDVLRLGQKSDSVLPNSLIKQIEVDREIGLTLYASYYENGRTRAIKLGYDDYQGKYNLLKAVFFHMEKRDTLLDFGSIDLINVNRIVVNPVKIQSPAENHKEV
jgi:cell division protein FtsQ